MGLPFSRAGGGSTSASRFDRSGCWEKGTSWAFGSHASIGAANAGSVLRRTQIESPNAGTMS